MKAILRGISGPATDTRVVFDEEHGISVGRNVTCTVSLPTDSFLSDRHFQLTIDQGQIVLRDFSSTNGTFVNGIRVREHVLERGETVQAGKSTFGTEFNVVSIPSVVEVLSRQPEPLYAVLDAARDPAIYQLILGCGVYHTSLYLGKSARSLETVAPYLLYLAPGSGVLQTIIERGWSKSWGIFLTSSQPTETVWKDLRRSLYVTIENQERVYFRFYDPRVLRVFLPIADAAQRAEFNGTISSFFAEDEVPGVLLRFHSLAHSFGLERITVRLAEVPQKQTDGAEEYVATQLIQQI